jgi:hypothetical protein
LATSQSVWRRNRMVHYRAYHVDDHNRVFGTAILVCADDQSAIEHAERLVNGHDVEVWRRERLVVRLTTKSATKQTPKQSPKSQGTNASLNVW